MGKMRVPLEAKLTLGWRVEVCCLAHPEFLVQGLRRTERLSQKVDTGQYHTRSPDPGPRAILTVKEGTGKAGLRLWVRSLFKSGQECSVDMEGGKPPGASGRAAGRESPRIQKKREGARGVWSPGMFFSEV